MSESGQVAATGLFLRLEGSVTEVPALERTHCEVLIPRETIGNDANRPAVQVSTSSDRDVQFLGGRWATRRRDGPARREGVRLAPGDVFSSEVGDTGSPDQVRQVIRRRVATLFLYDTEDLLPLRVTTLISAVLSLAFGR